MSRIGSSNNVHKPDKKCFGCRYWHYAERSSHWIDFGDAGKCTAGYCKKDAITQRRKNK